MSVDGYKEIVRELEDENRKLREERAKLIEGLMEIDTHIRATSEPIPHIVKTLKRLLYSE